MSHAPAQMKSDQNAPLSVNGSERGETHKDVGATTFVF